jgi:hypothetical protein
MDETNNKIRNGGRILRNSNINTFHIRSLWNNYGIDSNRSFSEGAISKDKLDRGSAKRKQGVERGNTREKGYSNRGSFNNRRRREN